MPAADGNAWAEGIDRDGFAIVLGVFAGQEVECLAADLESALALATSDSEAIRAAGGAVYAARNILTLFPHARAAWRRPPLVELLRSVLGPACGLVRGLYFDKPPERTWTLPWHKDLTISVRDNRLTSRSFCKPTTKAGVPHVEAPRELLEEMLTLRVHLDDVTEENGPLRVIPGSHKSGKELDLGLAPAQSILVHRGDVLAIRPLVAHTSAASHPGTTRHRRILHLEFAASPDLPDGYRWHEFVPCAPG